MTSQKSKPHVWQLQDAKARLSELIATARKSGPQIITQRGVKSAVVIPFDRWEQEQNREKPSLLELLRSGPDGDLQLPPRADWLPRKRIKL